jgi:predicted site-specific integrase-resolvase
LAKGKRASARPRVALYAHISTRDQQMLPLQIKTMREFAVRRHINNDLVISGIDG